MTNKNTQPDLPTFNIGLTGEGTVETGEDKVEFHKINDGRELNGLLLSVLGDADQAVFMERSRISVGATVSLEGEGTLVRDVKANMKEDLPKVLDWRIYGEPAGGNTRLGSEDDYALQIYQKPDGGVGSSIIVVHYSSKDISEAFRFTKYVQPKGE